MFKTALEVINKIENMGYKAYIVGGYPRDLYLNRPSIDIDICTNATPKELKEIFEEVNLSNTLYGSVTIYYNKIRFEITTFRRELKYVDNRYPVKIKYIDSLLEDIERRDFTINTLCIDTKGTTIDLINAKEDIDNKIIKVVGNTKNKIKDDSLRILRALRFATTLNFKLDDELKKYIKKYRHLLKKLSYNRKKEELDKIFSSKNVLYGIDLIKELELAKPLELKNINKVVQTTTSIGIWSQLEPINYQFSKNEKELMKNINYLLNQNILDNNILYKYGLYVCSIVGEIKGIDRKLITVMYDNLKIKNKKDISISPKEICELLNKKPDKFLKTLIDDLEIKLINNNLNNNKDDLIEYIKNNYKNIKNNV